MLNGEMKDIRAANVQFGLEIERNQVTLRRLQQELAFSIEEKKEFNSKVLDKLLA